MALLADVLLTAAPGLVTAQASSDATCYWPDGSETGDNYLPCGDGGTPHSTCCSRGWMCLSNGLCMAAGQDPDNLAEASIVQGGCTDRTWRTMDCTSWCVDDDDLEDVLNRAQPINNCPGSNNTFYCALADDNDDCDEEGEIIRFPGALRVMTTIGVTSTSSSSSSSSTTSSGPTSGQASTTDPAESSGAGPSDPANTGEGDGGGDSGGGGPDPLAIGLGVGIGVGGLGLVVAIVFFLLWRRRGRKAKAAADNEEGDGAGEKSAAAVAGAGGTAELPTTLSKDVHEASPDAMVAEAPSGDQRLGRVEAPLNEKVFEVATAEGTQGRHELVGSEVPAPAAAAQRTDVSPAGASTAGDASPQDCSTLGTSTLDASTLGNSTMDVSPVSPSVATSSPTNITRKPVG